jgi:hypothetical protein
MARQITPKTAQQWGAVAPQFLGIVGLIFCAVVWLASNRIEPLLLSAFGGLIFVGQAGEAVVQLKTAPPQPVSTEVTGAQPENGSA